MEQELSKEEFDEIMAEYKKLDLAIIEKDEDVVQYIYSLLKASEQFYIAIKTGTYDKVLILDTERVYQYNKDQDCFEVSDLCLNTEEDYVVLQLIDIHDEIIPVFKISTTQAELGTFAYLYNLYIKYPYYSWKFKREVSA